MAKRIPRIGYIEFKDGHKVDIINTYSLPDGDIEIIAVDGLYRYSNCWSTIDEIGYQFDSLKVVVPRNSLYKVAACPNGSYELVEEYNFLKFVLFRNF